MPELRRPTMSDAVIVIGFQLKAAANHVVDRLSRAVRHTDMVLLSVIGDDRRVYPGDGESPLRNGSTWRAELAWHGKPPAPAWYLEIFLARAGILLGCPWGVWVETTAEPDTPPREIHRFM